MSENLNEVLPKTSDSEMLVMSSSAQIPIARSNVTTPASSVTGMPVSRIKPPSNFKGSRPCCLTAPKAGPPPRDTSNSMSRESDDNLSSINSTYTDHGAVLTVDTNQFIIGQKVWVGGIRPGQIAYIGETHFAPGEWAGVVLDEPNGKNDGCVNGRRYFQCEPKRGIFSRLTRLTLYPLPNAQTPTSPLSKNSPDRSRTVSPTSSLRSSYLRSPGKGGLLVGDRVIVSSGFGSRAGILRYLGETRFASGNWCGIELDEPTGKNDGSVDGIKYFECKPKYGVFVPIAKVSLSPSSKKTPKLSRTGSRESLTSVGTMNSIATTNTSRLRMSAQRKSSLIKPISTPKSQFSMQDLIRDKQNNIEQLMIERDLDREDAQNQALQFQKNISELKAQVAQLTQKLDKERKKTEDLQFSIDEAQFCGDELSAQTQVYRERITYLERRIKELSNGRSDQKSPSDANDEEINEFSTKLVEHSEIYEKKITELSEELLQYNDKITQLEKENSSLKELLQSRDGSSEGKYISSNELENLRSDIEILKKQNEIERQQMNLQYLHKVEEKNFEIIRLKEDLANIKCHYGTLESERTNVEDECEILRVECKNRNDQLQDLNTKVVKLTAELSAQMAESLTLDEVLRNQQKDFAQNATALEQKTIENVKLKNELLEMQKIQAQMEAQLQSTADKLKMTTESEMHLEDRLKEAQDIINTKTEVITNMKTNIESLNQQVSESTTENVQLKTDLNNLIAKNNIIEESNNKFKEKQILYEKIEEELGVTKNQSEILKTNVEELTKSSETKSKEIENLKMIITELEDKTKTLESDSSSTIQEQSEKIKQLETQIEKMKKDSEVIDRKFDNVIYERNKLQTVISETYKDYKDATKELDATNNLLAELKEEHKNLIAKYNDTVEREKRLFESRIRYEIRLEEIACNFKALESQCEMLTEQNNSLQDELSQSRTSCTDLRTEVRNLNEKLTGKQNDFLKLQSTSNEERIHLVGLIEGFNQKLNNAINDNEECKDALQKSKDELILKNEEITALNEATVKQELQLSDAKRQLENLQSKYDVLANQNETLQNDLTTLRSTSTDSNAEILKLSQDLAAQQTAYQELLDKSNEERSLLESQLQASQQRIDNLCGQVETLTLELKNTAEENSNHVEELKQKQEKTQIQQLELSDLKRKLETLTINYGNLEKQNESLSKDISAIRADSTNVNMDVAKLTAELSNKQKELQEFIDKANAEKLQYENQMQNLNDMLATLQSDNDRLQSELNNAVELNNAQVNEFETEKANIEFEKQAILTNFTINQNKETEIYETQIKSLEQKKIKADEAIFSLQNQIQLLQDELLKSQLNFKSKEEEFRKTVAMLSTERDELNITLENVQKDDKNLFNKIQMENHELEKRVQQFKKEVEVRDEQLLNVVDEKTHLLMEQSKLNYENEKLEDAVKKLRESFEFANEELTNERKLLNDTNKRVEELKQMLESTQALNTTISATNAEMSEELAILDHERCEANHIFELFEMETDQNMTKLHEKVSDIKIEASEAQKQLIIKEEELNKLKKVIECLNLELESSHGTVKETQESTLEQTKQINELKQTNEELKKVCAEKDAKIQQLEELETRLTEYKQIIDEFDEASKVKTTKLSQLEERVAKNNKENEALLVKEKTLLTECAVFQGKLQKMEVETTREIDALKQRLIDVQNINTLKQKGAGDVNTPNGDGETSVEQINFLNSIIADMQMKNEHLKAKVEALEALPTDFTKPNAFDLISKRKPAPRVFCDICDEFDKHDTEDCPVQASSDNENSPTPPINAGGSQKERKIPEPRKYCENCEVFGHDVAECAEEDFY